jgi:hypothetical protein
LLVIASDRSRGLSGQPCRKKDRQTLDPKSLFAQSVRPILYLRRLILPGPERSGPGRRHSVKRGSIRNLGYFVGRVWAYASRLARSSRV